MKNIYSSKSSDHKLGAHTYRIFTGLTAMNHPYSGNAYAYSNRDYYYTDYQDPLDTTAEAQAPKASGFHSFLPTQSLDSLPQSKSSPVPWAQKLQDPLFDDERSTTLSRHPYSSIATGSYSDAERSDSPHTRLTADSFPSWNADSPHHSQSPSTNHDRKRESLLRTQRSLDSFTAQVLERGLQTTENDYLGVLGGVATAPGHHATVPRSRTYGGGHAYARVHTVGAHHRRWGSDRPRAPLESGMNYEPPTTIRRKPSKKNPLSFDTPKDYEYLPNSPAPVSSRWDEKSVMTGGWQHPPPYAASDVGVRIRSPWARLHRRLRGAMKRIKRMLS